MTSQVLDQRKVDEFGEKMGAIGNNAMTSLMMSIGHQTGLFDTMSELPPSTSKQIAATAELNERYVREWLAAMVVSRIVEYYPLDETYALPLEHAAGLARAAGANNVHEACRLWPCWVKWNNVSWHVSEREAAYRTLLTLAFNT